MGSYFPVISVQTADFYENTNICVSEKADLGKHNDEYINKLAKMVGRSIVHIFGKQHVFENWQDVASGARAGEEGTGAKSCHFSKNVDFQKKFPIDLHTILANLFIYSSWYSIIHVFSIFMIIYQDFPKPKLHIFQISKNEQSDFWDMHSPAKFHCESNAVDQILPNPLYGEKNMTLQI